MQISCGILLAFARMEPAPVPAQWCAISFLNRTRYHTIHRMSGVQYYSGNSVEYSSTSPPLQLFWPDWLRFLVFSISAL